MFFVFTRGRMVEKLKDRLATRSVAGVRNGENIVTQLWIKLAEIRTATIKFSSNQP